ncbi:MAG: DUF4271 domain-containing protein [Bacteroidales bacterium]|nr:DUF4271 domain-containing protein [Bacteroidales bacterium]
MNQFSQQDTTITYSRIADSSITDTNISSQILNKNNHLSDDSASSDSLFSSFQTISIEDISQPSIFTSHYLEVKDQQPFERNIFSHDWITIHLLICLCLFAWVQIYYKKRLKQIVKAFTGMRYLNQLSRDGNIFKERIAIPLLIIYLVSFSLLIYLFFTLILESTYQNMYGLKLFSGIMLFILLAWFIKNLVLNFIGNVFNNYLIVTEYILTNFIFNMITGLVLLPFIIVSVYMPSQEMIYAGAILWVLVFIYRLIRELITGLSYTKFSLFNRILYLCIFEIIPLLAITKLVMNYLT